MISMVSGAQLALPPAHPLLYSAVMHKLLTFVLVLPVVACVVGESENADPGQDNGQGGGGSSGGGGGGSAGVTNHLTSNTMWSGAMMVSGTTTVDPGVTLTIAAGTKMEFASSARLDVQGIVDIQGTKTAPVTLAPASVGSYAFYVTTGGELKINYATGAGGSITVAGGKVTV